MSKKNETNPATEAKEITLQDLASVVGGFDDGSGSQEDADGDSDSEHRRSNDGRSEYKRPKSG
jgi:hypothetical protein